MVQAVYAAFGRGDIGAVLDALADEIERFPRGARARPVPGPPARARREIAQFFGVLAATLEFELIGAHEFIAQGDRIVFTSRDCMRGTGSVAETDWAAVFGIRVGKITSHKREVELKLTKQSKNEA